MGVGPRKQMAGLTGIDEGADASARGGDVYVIEARSGDGWRELERTTSSEAAESALDELAATRGIDLGEMRVRAID